MSPHSGSAPIGYLKLEQGMAANPTTEVAPVFITCQHAAKLLGVKVWTVYDLMNDGVLPRIRVRTAVRTRLDSVMAYIEEQTRKATEAAPRA
jgi:excisionase family DNA binding protein